MQEGPMGDARLDYFPFLEADAYGDYALKFLLNKAAKEKLDFVAVMPFNKLHFRQGYKAGNERFYGYASGKGIDKKGQAVYASTDEERLLDFNDSKAGTIKISLSDPSNYLTKKLVKTENLHILHDAKGSQKRSY